MNVIRNILIFTLSYNNQRGRGREQWGQGFSGATIKDTWTKPRGREEAREGGEFGWGGGESGGENADNYN